MNEKLQENQRASCGPPNVEETKSMNAMKETLMPLAVLALPQSTGLMTLDAVACTVQVGCLVSRQLED